MKSEWREVSLGDVIEIKHGFAFKSEYFVDKASGYVLTTPGNFAIGGGFQEQNPKFYDGPIPADYVLKSDDLIITMTDLSKAGDTLGFGALIPKVDDFIYLHNQRIGLVQQKNQAYETDKKYLAYLLRMSDYRHWIVGSATGSTVKHTSPSRIQAYKFCLPPLPEQKAIARILSSLDDKIELNRRMNATLEQMAQALFRAWFVDFEPVKAKAAGLQPTSADSQTAELFPSELVESELGLIPEGWEVGKIDDLVDIVGGGTPSTKVMEYWEPGEHFWATPKDLSNLQFPILLKTERQISDLGLQKISSSLLPPGTILLSSRAPIGYLAITEIPVAINQGFIGMLPRDSSVRFFVLHWAKGNLELIKSRANGSTFLEVSKTNFRPITLIVPPKPLLELFERQVDKIHRQMVCNEKQSQTLTQLRDTLLPRLISGRLRVPEAVKELETL